MTAEPATYCPRCGTALKVAEVSGREREVCPSCGFILFRNPVPGVGVLVEMDGNIVLVKRGQPPFVGSWALPAGYIEADESVEQAAVRECKEETGLDVELLELFGVYSFPEGPVQSGIIIFYRARPVGGELRAGDDAQDVRHFAPETLPDHVAFRTHREVLARWLRSRSPGSGGQAGTGAQAGDVLIRAALGSDEAQILRLLPLIPANEGMDAAETQAVAQRLRENLAMDVLVAELQGEVVGFLALSLVPTLSGLRTLITDLAVDAAHRRQGIGGSLLEAAVQWADRRGATHLLVDTSRGDPATRDFYQACGFEPNGLAPLRIR
jgi:ADP-ribose pyrophosphatase YjhB (NUDIX family)/GNAT superfamily N-acetyltransferase